MVSDRLPFEFALVEFARIDRLDLHLCNWLKSFRKSEHPMIIRWASDEHQRASIVERLEIVFLASLFVRVVLERFCFRDSIRSSNLEHSRLERFYPNVLTGGSSLDPLVVPLVSNEHRASFTRSGHLNEIFWIILVLNSSNKRSDLLRLSTMNITAIRPNSWDLGNSTRPLVSCRNAEYQPRLEARWKLMNEGLFTVMNTVLAGIWLHQAPGEHKSSHRSIRSDRESRVEIIEHYPGQKDHLAWCYCDQAFFRLAIILWKFTEWFESSWANPWFSIFSFSFSCVTVRL